MKYFKLIDPEWWQKSKGLLSWDLIAGSLPGLDYAYGDINPKSGMAHIRSIEVNEKYRRKGIGKRAIQELERFLIQQHVSRVNGWVKEGSESFWAAMGYTVTPVRGHLPRLSKSLRDSALLDEPEDLLLKKALSRKRTYKPHSITLTGEEYQREMEHRRKDPNDILYEGLQRIK